MKNYPDPSTMALRMEAIFKEAGHSLPRALLQRGLYAALELEGLPVVMPATPAPMSADWLQSMVDAYLDCLAQTASSQASQHLGGPFTVADLHPNSPRLAKVDCQKFANFACEHIRASALTPEQVGRGLARIQCGLAGFEDCNISKDAADHLQALATPWGAVALHRNAQSLVVLL